jgi:hypothetical protein
MERTEAIIIREAEEVELERIMLDRDEETCPGVLAVCGVGTGQGHKAQTT